MVLVDSTAPASAANPGTPSPGHGGSSDGMSRVSALVSASARLGLARLYARSDFGSLPPRSRDEVRASVATASMLRSTIDEYLQAAASTEQAAALGDFADKLIVLTAGSGHDAAWSAAQNRMATLSTNSVHRIIDGATHEDLIATKKTPPPPRKRSSTSSHRSGAQGAWSADPEPQQRLGAPPRPVVGGLDDAGDARASDAARSWPATSAQEPPPAQCCRPRWTPIAAPTACGIEGSAPRREHPVGVRYPSRSVPWPLAFLLGR